MSDYRVNESGRRKAEEMIDSGQYDLETEWEDANPDAEEGNDQIERHGYTGFGEWHLAIDVTASEETKDRFGFPHGDFRRVFRSALIHAKQRATQYGHQDVAGVADALLDRLDSRRGGSD